MISIVLSISFLISLAYLRRVNDRVGNTHFLSFLFPSILFFSQIIRWSSPLFLALIGFGSILIICTNFTWFPHLVTDTSCHLRFWLNFIQLFTSLTYFFRILNYGFILFYGPLWAKTIRIVFIVRASKSLELVRVSDTSLLLFLGGLFAVDTVLVYNKFFASNLFLSDPVTIIFYLCFS